MKRSLVILLTIIFATLISIAYWLTSDDPKVIYSTNIEDYAPPPPDGYAGYQQLLQLSINVENQESGVTSLLNDLDAALADPAKLAAFLDQHQLEIDAELAALEPYLGEMHHIALAESIGSDITSFEDPIVAFQGMRTLTNAEILRFKLCTAKQERPCDVNGLLSVLRLYSNWFPHSRTLVHRMVIVVCEMKVLKTIEKNLSHITQDQLLALQTSLQFDHSDYGAGIITGVWTDYCITANIVEETHQGMSAIERFVFLPNNTLNRYGEYVNQSQCLYEQGRFADLQTLHLNFEQELENYTEFRLENAKNRVGQLVLVMAIPAFGKATEQGRALNQLRAEIITAIDARLAELGTESATAQP